MSAFAAALVLLGASVAAVGLAMLALLALVSIGITVHAWRGRRP